MTSGRANRGQIPQDFYKSSIRIWLHGESKRKPLRIFGKEVTDLQLNKMAFVAVLRIAEAERPAKRPLQ